MNGGADEKFGKAETNGVRKLQPSVNKSLPSSPRVNEVSPPSTSPHEPLHNHAPTQSTARHLAEQDYFDVDYSLTKQLEDLTVEAATSEDARESYYMKNLVQPVATLKSNNRPWSKNTNSDDELDDYCGSDLASAPSTEESSVQNRETFTAPAVSLKEIALLPTDSEEEFSLPAVVCRNSSINSIELLYATPDAPPSPPVSTSALAAEVQRLRRRNEELQAHVDARATSQEAGAWSREEAASASLPDEHRIFARAILDLLTTRDQLAAEARTHGPHTIKVGALRKASHRIKGRWKTRYVELRTGTFSYFEDSPKQRSSRHLGRIDPTACLSRKDIPLKGLCTCQAVKLRSVKILPGNSGGAVFELQIRGGSRRLWMAPTREERESWIRAIHSAVPGASVTRGDNFSEYQGEQAQGKKKKTIHNLPLTSPHRRTLEQYLGVRAASQGAESKSEYLGAVACLRGRKIAVPVQLIRLQLDTTVAAAFLEAEISLSVEQLWKDLIRDSVDINGCIITGDSVHGPDRMLGALTQQILLADAASRGRCTSDRTHRRITEAEAVSHARDILLASNRTRSGGDSYFVAEHLCTNRDLVVLCPSATDAAPLSIAVSAPGARRDAADPDVADLRGWASGRRRGDAAWRRQHVVLSRSVLSCYAEAPRALLERIDLRGATVGDASPAPTAHSDAAPSLRASAPEYILNIATGQVVREYLFEDEFDFMIWHASLKKSAGEVGDSPNDLGISPGIRCEESAPSVDVVVNVCTEYKLCTLDPSGIESEDTWALLRTTFLQQMSLTGGGRMARGDEVVEIEML